MPSSVASIPERLHRSNSEEVRTEIMANTQRSIEDVEQPSRNNSKVDPASPSPPTPGLEPVVEVSSLQVSYFVAPLGPACTFVAADPSLPHGLKLDLPTRTATKPFQDDSTLQPCGEGPMASSQYAEPKGPPRKQVNHLLYLRLHFRR